MKRGYGWFIGLMLVALVVAACGPQMATPTPVDEVAAGETAGDTQEKDPAEEVAEPADVPAPTKEPAAPTDKPDPAEESDAGEEQGVVRALGPVDAPVTIVEYSDFQCPYCGRYISETYPQILENYIETGQVRYIFKHFPLYSIHPQAEKAAEAAECAGEQGAFWEMHDALFADVAKWSIESPEAALKEMAGDLGLDQAQFDKCLDDGKYNAKVTADYQEGLQEGVTGTPAFRINGVSLSGAQPFAAFQQQIEYFLAGGEQPSLEVDADSFRSMGQADAPVVVTEFSDYLCPACASVEQSLIPELIEQYVETGKVRFVYREFPLESLHPNAPKASEAAICAGKQDKYWEMHEKLFATSAEWESGDPIAKFKGYAEELGLDSATFDECLDSGEGATVVKGDQLAGQMAGVNATPYFFINELPVRGGLPIQTLGQVIDYVAAGGPTPEIVPTEQDWRLRGNTSTASAIAVAFVDYASAESGEHAREVLPELVDTYIDSGQLIYVLHPWSQGANTPSAAAAVAAECAGEQGQYWEMHDQLFAEQEEWSAVDETATVFGTYAEGLNLDAAKFAECLDSDWANLRVQSGNVLGALYGVPGAPVFLFSNGTAQQGSPTIEEFSETIESIVNP